MESSLTALSPSLPPFPRSHSLLITSFPAIFSRALRQPRRLRKIDPPLLTVTASCSSQAPLRSARTVGISYTELKSIPFLDKNADLSSKIEEGFGANGFGLLSISDVPEYSLLRKNLPHLSSRLANVSEDVKRELEDPVSRYIFGWSYGKQIRNGKLDELKASFYANPTMDVPTTEPSLIQQYPSYCRANIWPRTALPELEIAFKALGKLILNVGLLLAHHCDKYGLTCEMFTKDDVEIPCSDNAAGLYIKSRTGQVVKPEYGEDEIAYLVGETCEILSRHLLRATPHFVQAPKGVEASTVGSSTFALFMQPHWDEKFNFSEVAHIHEELRYSNHSQTFGEYSERLLDKYY